MEIEDKTVVSLRYVMKNDRGEVLENTMNGAPVTYLHGGGIILRPLESSLTGLHAGDKKSLSLTNTTVPGLEYEFYFEVIIDEVRMATEDELVNGKPAAAEKENCGPQCRC